MFFNWYMKQSRFPSGTGNAGLAIIPTNCGCLRHHRPCFKSGVDLWYLASSDLGKSSMLLLLLPAASATYVSPYSCLRSQPQNSTWGASEVCESIHLSLRYFWMGGAIQKYQEELSILFLYSSGPKKGTGLSHFTKFGAIPFISVPHYTSN